MEPILGEVTDVTVIGDRLVTVGWVGTSAEAGMNILVQAHDIRTGARQWEDLHDVAGKKDYAMSVSATAGRIVVGGLGSTAAGDENIMMRAYRPR